MRSALVLAVLLAVAAAGCSLGSSDERTANPPATTPVRPDIRRALELFLDAAASVDGERVAEHVSRPTRERGEEPDGGLRALARADDYDLVVAEAVSVDWGVAAIARGEEAYAVPFRLENGAWKVELGGPVRLRPIAPDPGAVKGVHAQVAVEIAAEAPIAFGALYLDGAPVAPQGGGPSPRYVTIFGSTGELEPGVHVVVAFAQAGEEASATAWTFRVRDRAATSS